MRVHVVIGRHIDCVGLPLNPTSISHRACYRRKCFNDCGTCAKVNTQGIKIIGHSSSEYLGLLHKRLPDLVLISCLLLAAGVRRVYAGLQVYV
jgi:hypothetical protein